jgi:hypothetical protein
MLRDDGQYGHRRRRDLDQRGGRRGLRGRLPERLGCEAFSRLEGPLTRDRSDRSDRSVGAGRGGT